MLFCPIPWCTDPMEEEYSASKNDLLQTPDLKPKDSVTTPATESTEASSMSSGDSLASDSKPDQTAAPGSPVRPQALQFDDATDTAKAVAPKKASSSTTSYMSWILKLIVFLVLWMGVNKGVLDADTPSKLLDSAKGVIENPSVLVDSVKGAMENPSVLVDSAKGVIMTLMNPQEVEVPVEVETPVEVE